MGESISAPSPLSDGGKKAVKPQKWRFRADACVRIIRPTQRILVRAGGQSPVAS